MATELARVVIDFVNDMVDAVCLRLGPIVGARPKEVKIGLGVALGLIALHRLITAPAKREPSAALPRDTGAGAEARAARPGDAAARARETGRAETAAAAAAGLEQMKGAKRITIATLGVLLSKASDGAMSLVAGAAEALKQAAKGSETYLITQVESDEAEAAARAALKEGNVLGTAPGQVAPHRALFCSTGVGRIALVRQIGPDLHVDASYETVKELQRFGTKAVYVAEAKLPEGVPPVPTVAGLQVLFFQ